MFTDIGWIDSETIYSFFLNGDLNLTLIWENQWTCDAVKQRGKPADSQQGSDMAEP